MRTLKLEKQGETITFFDSTDPGAPALTGELRMEPGAEGPPPHVHPGQRETFEVASGRMSVTVGDVERELGAGEQLVVEAGQVHTFANGSATDPLVVRTSVEPPMSFEWFLSEMARSAIRNGGSWSDVPFLEAAYMIHQVRDEYRLAALPARLHGMVFRLLARLAVLLGRTRQIAPKPQPREG